MTSRRALAIVQWQQTNKRWLRVHIGCSARWLSAYGSHSSTSATQNRNSTPPNYSLGFKLDKPQP